MYMKLCLFSLNATSRIAVHELFWSLMSDEAKPREITPGAFNPCTSTSFDLNFSVEMVEGVVRLTSKLDESQKVNSGIVLLHEAEN